MSRLVARSCSLLLEVLNYLTVVWFYKLSRALIELKSIGFRGLNPSLTVVRKANEHPLKADDYLPSAMTSVNYLKLPEHSSKQVLKDKLKVAIQGVASFYLSWSFIWPDHFTLYPFLVLYSQVVLTRANYNNENLLFQARLDSELFDDVWLSLKLWGSVAVHAESVLNGINFVGT